MPRLRRYLPLLLALLGLLLPLLALAQGVDPAPMASATSGADSSALPPGLSYVLGAGPVGALVYGAWLMGRGVRVGMDMKFSEEDRELLRRFTVAVEDLAATQRRAGA